MTTYPSRLCQRLMDHLDEITLRNNPPLDVLEKINHVKHTLLSSNPSLYRIKQILRSGIPDIYPGLRSICWKIALGALPVNPAEWDIAMRSNVEVYNSYRNELVREMLKVQEVISNAIKSYSHEKPPADPLAGPTRSSPFNSSGVITNYNLILNSREELLRSMLEQIDKDVFRTRPEMGFFFQPLASSENEQDSWGEVSKLLWVPNSDDSDAHAATLAGERRSLRDATGAYGYTRPMPSDGSQETDMASPRIHYDLLGRILFVYASLNSGIQYIQGMNELLAPLFFSSFTDPLIGLSSTSTAVFPTSSQKIFSSKQEEVDVMSVENSPSSQMESWELSRVASLRQAEADTFVMFTGLMQDQRDLFCRALDQSASGIKGRISEFESTLLRCDVEVGSHLSRLGVEGMFYSMRWIMLWFSQEFDLPDVIRLWDAILPDSSSSSLKSSDDGFSSADGIDSGEALVSPESYANGLSSSANGKYHLLPPRVTYIAVSMVISLRETLLLSDFAACMKLLQRFPPLDVASLLPVADLLRSDDCIRLHPHLFSNQKGGAGAKFNLAAIGQTLRRLKQAGQEKAVGVANAILERRQQQMTEREDFVSKLVRDQGSVDEKPPTSAPSTSSISTSNTKSNMNNNINTTTSNQNVFVRHPLPHSSDTNSSSEHSNASLLADPLAALSQAKANSAQKQIAAANANKQQPFVGISREGPFGDVSWFEKEMASSNPIHSPPALSINHTQSSPNVLTNHPNVDERSSNVRSAMLASDPLSDVNRLRLNPPVPPSAASVPSTNNNQAPVNHYLSSYSSASNSPNHRHPLYEDDDFPCQNSYTAAYSFNAPSRTFASQVLSAAREGAEGEVVQSAVRGVTSVANSIANWFGGSTTISGRRQRQEDQNR
eukprot:GDKJ01019674.1.p1 GENE.GDKJ01019674.1~~GDKJ01019674.1.p1  ORF type:complete len:890 (-),score=198.72 GDKJ01019674.1:192-2861(-)